MLEMYYLQSRYYAPTVGRFLNADSYISSDSSVLGCNMFAYCGNNPVMGYDPTGEFSWGTLFSGASLLAIGITACAAAITVVTAGACTPLLIAATVTFVAGAATVVNGTAEVIESATGYNFVRDGLLQGNEELYETQKEILSSVAEIGTALITMGSASGKLCFAAGTVILVNEGRKAIEDIVVGDYVWAWDEETGEKSLRRVTETYVNQTSELVHVFVGGEEIVTTPTHPFYSPVKGWTEAAQLRAGDILVLVNGEYVVVEKVQHEILESPINVYNFQVAGDHTYYVSDIGVLVHNGCSKIGGGHGSPTHASRIDDMMDSLVKSGKYSEVYGNRALSTAGLKGSQRPDIIAKKLDGSFEVWEFASKSQAGGSGLAALEAKIKIMHAANPTAYFYDIIPWG